MGVSEERKIVARAVLGGFGGGNPTVTKYWDASHVRDVDILSVSCCPQPGVTSWATIGVFEHSIGLTVDDKPLRIEFVGACRTESTVFANVLASCAFSVMNSGKAVRPGDIIRQVVDMNVPDSPMKHVLLTSPFTWNNRLMTLHLEAVKIAWLLAVPISQGELELAKKAGVPGLESLLEDRHVDVFDLYRASEA